MDVLWKDGDVPAKYVADTLNREVGWNKNTTYTLIKRCINKGAIERTEPGFMCHALIAKNRYRIWKQMNLLIRYMMDLLTSCLRHFLAEKTFYGAD